MFTEKSFSLTDEQYEKIEKWANDHDCAVRGISCCGGEISVEFTPTTIRTFITAKCCCGEEIAID